MRIVVCYAFGPDAIPLGENIARGFEALGHAVIRYDSRPDERRMPARRTIKSLAKLVGGKHKVSRYFERREEQRQAASFLECVERTHPDRVIVIRGESIPVSAIEACRHLGVSGRIVWWVKHPRWQDRLLSEAPHFDAAFSIDGSLASHGIRVLPSWALQPDIYFADQRQKTIPLLFAGSYSERRLQFLERLADLPLTIVGPGWHRHLPISHPLRKCLGARWLPSDKLAELYRDAYVVIDIHQIWQDPGQGTSMRFADVPACGTLLLTEPSVEVEQWFQPGVHLVLFTSADDLYEQATSLVRELSQAESMGKAAAEQARKLPTFLDRANELLRRQYP